MKFTPKRLVSYHGVLHAPGNPFEVDPKDEKRMRAYGDFETVEEHTEETHETEKSEEEVSEEETADDAAEETVEEHTEEQPARKPGRPKKN